MSKDAILLAANQHAPWIYWVGTITAGMTAFYVFRAFFMTFFGEYRGHGHHPHESPPVMLAPLVILAALSLVGGYLFRVPEFLAGVFPAREVPEDFSLMAIASGFGLAGIALAYILYVARPDIPETMAAGLKGIYTLIYNKYFVDEIYDATVVKPVVGGSRVLLWKGMDAGLIDGMVNGIGARAQNIGGALRLLQSGNIRSYATWVAFGAVLVVVALGVAEGIR